MSTGIFATILYGLQRGLAGLFSIDLGCKIKCVSGRKVCCWGQHVGLDWGVLGCWTGSSRAEGTL